MHETTSRLRLRQCSFSTVLGLAHREWNVLVSNHVPYLSSHSQGKQDQPVHHQDRPEYGQVEDLEPAAHEADGHRSSRTVPELEFRQSSDEGSEFLVLFCG